MQRKPPVNNLCKSQFQSLDILSRNMLSTKIFNDNIKVGIDVKYVEAYGSVFYTFIDLWHLV
jgi:hypothetical protein